MNVSSSWADRTPFWDAQRCDRSCHSLFSGQSGITRLAWIGIPNALLSPHARAGDIVVLCPEYHVMMDESQQIGDPIVTNQLTEQWPGAKKYLPRETPESLKQFLDHDGLLLAHQWVSRSIKMIRGRDRQSDKLYRRSSFNEYGDLVGHYKIKSGELTAFGGIPTPEEALLEQTASIINRFANQCKEKGVEVYFSFPPLPSQHSKIHNPQSHSLKRTYERNARSFTSIGDRQYL